MSWENPINVILKQWSVWMSELMEKFSPRYLKTLLVVKFLALFLREVFRNRLNTSCCMNLITVRTRLFENQIWHLPTSRGIKIYGAFERQSIHQNFKGLLTLFKYSPICDFLIWLDTCPIVHPGRAAVIGSNLNICPCGLLKGWGCLALLVMPWSGFRAWSDVMYFSTWDIPL